MSMPGTQQGRAICPAFCCVCPSTSFSPDPYLRCQFDNLAIGKRRGYLFDQLGQHWDWIFPVIGCNIARAMARDVVANFAVNLATARGLKCVSVRVENFATVSDPDLPQPPHNRVTGVLSPLAVSVALDLREQWRSDRQ